MLALARGARGIRAAWSTGRVLQGGACRVDGGRWRQLESRTVRFGIVTGPAPALGGGRGIVVRIDETMLSGSGMFTSTPEVGRVRFATAAGPAGHAPPAIQIARMGSSAGRGIHPFGLCRAIRAIARLRRRPYAFRHRGSLFEARGRSLASPWRTAAGRQLPSRPASMTWLRVESFLPRRHSPRAWPQQLDPPRSVALAACQK